MPVAIFDMDGVLYRGNVVMPYAREGLARLEAGELYDVFPGDLDVDLVPPEDWAPKEAEMAAVFVDFLSRAQAKAA